MTIQPKISDLVAEIPPKNYLNKWILPTIIIFFQVGQNAETEKLAFKKLEECISKPVLFSGGISNCCLLNCVLIGENLSQSASIRNPVKVKTSISYKGHIDDDSPISGKVSMFFILDYLKTMNVFRQ